MKKRYSRILIGMMLLMTTVLLSACGKSESKEGITTSKAKDLVYRMDGIEGVKQGTDIGQFFKTGEKVYAKSTNWNDTNQTSNLIVYEVDTEAGLKETFNLELGESVYECGVTADNQGNFYVVVDETIEDMTDPDNPIYTENYYLIGYDAKGTELWRVLLNENKQLHPNENDYFYAYGVTYVDDKLLLQVANGIAVFSMQGELMSYNDFTATMPDASFNGMILLRDNRLMVEFSTETALNYCEMDIATGELKEQYEFPGQWYNYAVYAGYDTDLLLADSIGVYTMNIGDTQMKQIMSFVDSDLDLYGINMLQAIDDKTFLGIISNDETGYNELVKFTKVPPEEVVDKEVLTLACTSVNWDVRKAVINFNKTNSKYRIQIIDYDSLYATDDDYEQGVTKLNSDIVSGKIPDILQIDTRMPVQSYISKGLLEDLLPYIDKDEKLDKNDLIPSVVEAYSIEGKMYQLVPSYTIGTVVGKTAIVGEKRGWTIEDAQAVLAKQKEGTKLFNDATRDTMLYNALDTVQNQFINWETGECNFNSEEFKQLLNWVKSFPAEYSYDGDGFDDMWQGSESMWREDRALLQFSSFGTFSDYKYAKYGTFGEDITLIGFPTSQGEGTVLSPSIQLAMSSKSSNKEGVWEFLGYFLGEEYQNSVTYGFPISSKRLDALGEEAKKKPYYEDENGNKVEYDDTYYLDGMEIVMPLLTDREIQDFKDIIYSVNRSENYSEAVYNIITEEASPFFNDQKTVDEVATIIQGRMQIYVDENR